MMNLKNSRWLHAIAILVIATMAGAARADVSISNVPLFVIGGVKSNLMFVLDDSGSMSWGFMPDDLDSKFRSGSHGKELGNCQGIYSFDGSELCALDMDGRRLLASPRLNNQYFDPEKTYTPPPKADGSRYPNADFSSARIDGYRSDSASLNLGKEYRAVMSDYYYYGNYWGGIITV